jgi:hypothetical protein
MTLTLRGHGDRKGSPLRYTLRPSHAKTDSVGEWYLGQKNRTSRRFFSVLCSLARHVERKMTIVVPVVPFTNRVKT